MSTDAMTHWNEVADLRDRSRGLAFAALSRSRYGEFGRYAEKWAVLNGLLPKGMQQRPPFRPLVQMAKVEAAGAR